MALGNTLTLLLAAASAAGASPSNNAIDPLRAPRAQPYHKRATDVAPKGYTPTIVDCPSDRPTIRDGRNLSKQEKDWTVTRRNETIPHIRDLFERFAIPGFNATEYLADAENDNTAVPNIGLAFSGGGYRAMLAGAGSLAALDARSAGSDAQGNLGGLLQASTYISGLSGGAWLVGSIYTNNFTTVGASVNSGAIWQLQDSILSGPEQYPLLVYYDDIFDSVGAKDDAGYERSITDYWGRMLSYQLINATDGGPGVTFSSIADDEEFKNARTPFPFVLAVGRRPDEELIPINSTVYEFSPWELGSSDPTVHGYMPLRWAGSNFTEGEIPEDGKCVEGFDNAGFVMGTSSSLFNQIVLYLNDPNADIVPDGIPDFAVEALSSILNAIGDDNNDIADWTPNPFKGWNPEENYNVDEDRLTLVDGGEDLQNVPYHPHLLIERKVDVVFSFDNSADTELSWPNGASPIATYERSLEDISNGTGFPVVPGKDTFLNLGLNTKPVFFGCDATNVSDAHPLIVYIPNYPYVFNSNTSTFKMSYNESERDAMIENGWAVATQLNSTRDENWPVCVGCAMLHRSFDRTNTTIPQECQNCFDRYCWNGTVDDAEARPYDPELFGEAVDVSEESFALKTVVNVMTLAVSGVAAALLL
jgi:lysophospholipase